MSLTSFLDVPDVRKKFGEMFPKPKFSEKRELVAPPMTKSYSTIGTGFDYLLRFYIERQNPQAISKAWIAKNALQLIKEEAYTRGKKRIAEKADSMMQEVERVYLAYLKTGDIDDNLLKAVITLAQFDPVFRAGQRVIDYVFAWIESGIIDDNDINDLRNLISLVSPEIFHTNIVCLLNPTFGAGSSLVGGADADIVMDGAIIDIKTIKDLKLPRDDFHQLIGYYSLYRIAGIEGLPSEANVSKVGIYFSRYGYRYMINVAEIIDENSFPEFLDWFIKRASQEFRFLNGFAERASSDQIAKLPPLLRKYAEHYRH